MGGEEGIVSSRASLQVVESNNPEKVTEPAFQKTINIPKRNSDLFG